MKSQPTHGQSPGDQVSIDQSLTNKWIAFNKDLHDSKSDFSGLNFYTVIETGKINPFLAQATRV
jgi:hypothetical protein